MRIPRAALVALVLAVSATSAAAEPRLLGIPTHVPAGGRLHIRWTGLGQEVHEAELELSLGGGRWTRISPELEAREGGFTWQLPAELSGPARLRLRYGGEGFEAEGRVSAPFVIERPAGVTQAPTLDAWWRVPAHEVPATRRALTGAASLSPLRSGYALAPQSPRSGRIARPAADPGRVGGTSVAVAMRGSTHREPSRRFPLRI